MKNVNQKIEGNGNVQVGGDLIKTEKVIRRTDVLYDKDEYISDSQAKEIRDRIEKIAKSKSKEDSSSYSKAYKSLYNKFNITKYSLLPKNEYEKAIKWLDKQVAINRPKLKNVDLDQWRKDMYRAIHARSNQLKIDIHDFAFDVLELKKPITSLKELSDLRLKKLHTKLFNKK